MSTVPPSINPPADLALNGPSAKAAFARWLDVIGPTLALVGIFVFFVVIIGPSFATFFNIHQILQQSTVVCIAGLGATFIIISAGIDLSIGSAVAMSAMLLATMLNLTAGKAGPSGEAPLILTQHPILWPTVCVLLAILTGLLTGLYNGFLITKLKLVPFIVTLGTMMIFRGVTQGISETAVNNPPNWVKNVLTAPDLPAWVTQSHFHAIWQWLYLAPGIWVALVLAILCAVVLKYFRFGRHVIAIGSSENTARLCGIAVNRNKIWIYLVGGFFAGVAGIMQYSRQKQGSPTANLGLELDVIAAVVIGGASLNGGKGSILGTIVGSLIMTVIASGCAQVPIPAWMPHFIGEGVGLRPYVQMIVTGHIIIVAVALDNLRQRRPT